MSWLETIIVVVVVIGGGLYLVLAVAIIVTALVERRLVNFLVPAGSEHPELQSLAAVAVNQGAHESPAFDSKPYIQPGKTSYAESQIRPASLLGYSRTSGAVSCRERRRVLG